MNDYRQPAGASEEATIVLVEHLRRQDPAAGALLTSMFRTALVRFCWGYLGRLDEAEDAVQDISVKVLRAPGVPDAFRPWLYRIARNHCLNVIRTHGRRREAAGSALDSQLPDVLTGQLTRLANDEVRAKLIQLIHDLPETHRELLRLRYVEGLPRSEIAEVLEVPESLVKSRLFETLKRLRDQAARLDGS